MSLEEKSTSRPQRYEHNAFNQQIKVVQCEDTDLEISEMHYESEY